MIFIVSQIWIHIFRKLSAASSFIPVIHGYLLRFKNSEIIEPQRFQPTKYCAFGTENKEKNTFDHSRHWVRHPILLFAAHIQLMITITVLYVSEILFFFFISLNRWVV